VSERSQIEAQSLDLTMFNELLNRPYPFIESTSIRLSLSFIIGLVVFLLLNTYRPFGIERIPESETAFIAGFGLIAMVSLMVTLFTFPFFEDIEKWTIKSEIRLHIYNWILTSIWVYAYNTLVGADLSPQHTLPTILASVAGLYLVPLLVMVYITEKHLQNRNEKEAKEIDGLMHNIDTPIAKTKDDQLIIRPESSTAPPIDIKLSDFIYAASDNNYVMLHYLENGQLQKQLLRLSLKNMESQLIDNSAVIRCHKSYLVNRNLIEEITGNARSLCIHMKHTESKIPVPRAFDRSLLTN